MNDFPVIGDLVMRTGLWDRQGAIHRNVWRGAVSLLKAEVTYVDALCEINAMKCIDKH